MINSNQINIFYIIDCEMFQSLTDDEITDISNFIDTSGTTVTNFSLRFAYKSHGFIYIAFRGILTQNTGNIFSLTSDEFKPANTVTGFMSSMDGTSASVRKSDKNAFDAIWIRSDGISLSYINDNMQGEEQFTFIYPIMS